MNNRYLSNTPNEGEISIIEFKCGTTLAVRVGLKMDRILDMLKLRDENRPGFVVDFLEIAIGELEGEGTREGTILAKVVDSILEDDSDLEEQYIGIMVCCMALMVIKRRKQNNVHSENDAQIEQQIYDIYPDLMTDRPLPLEVTTFIQNIFDNTIGVDN